MSSSVRAQTVQENEVVAPLAGRMYTPSPQPPNNFYGTDLGLTFKHKGELRILFGDTWADAGQHATIVNGGIQTGIHSVGTTNPPSDDSSGFICLEHASTGPCAGTAPLFPGGLDAYFYAGGHAYGGDSAFATQISWQRAAPPVNFFVDGSNNIAPFIVMANGTQLSMGTVQTPVAAFSRWPTSAVVPTGDPTAAAAFALFIRGEYATCTPSTASTDCGPGYTCDTQMATKSVNGTVLPCTSPDRDCILSSGHGLCLDTGSSMHANTPSPAPAADTDATYPDYAEARVTSVVHVLQLGNALQAGSPAQEFPTVFLTRPWKTNRFMNPVLKTVESFNPTDPAQNNYNPADGLGTTSGEKVLVWGRPAFAGDTNRGRSPKLYFGYVDMPSYAADGNVTWNVQYFTGVDAAGKPLFATGPVAAAPLKFFTDSTQTTTTDAETWDILNQMTISWVAPLQKWVMFYGGETFPDYTCPSNDQLCTHQLMASLSGLPSSLFATLHYDSLGAIHFRTADNPWGPWTAPQQLFPKDLTQLQYVQNGALRNPSCTDAQHCVAHEAPFDVLVGQSLVSQTKYGFFYGPNIIDSWTVDWSPNTPGHRSAQIFWNVSTWDPYQTIVVRSLIQI